MTLRNKHIVFALAAGFAFATGVTVFTLTRTPNDAHHVTQSSPAVTSQAVTSHEEPRGEHVSLRDTVAAITQPTLRAELDKLYAAAEYRPLWSDDRAGRKRLKSLDDVMQMLGSQGLDAAFITEAKTTLLKTKTTEERNQADIHMSAAILRAAQGQRFGFIDAKTLGWHLAADNEDVASGLGKALARNEAKAFFQDLAPRDPQFAALTEALIRYRAIATSGGWPTIAADKEIDFTNDARIPVLRQRLAAEGYVANDADTAKVVEALKVYQARNGLEPDGRAGRGTLAALNVPVDERIGQIVANLERWRHVRHAAPDEYVIANIADQTVAVVRDGKEDIRLRTVVGARRHATPMIEANLTAVTLNPPWNIPTSITTREILPKLDADPGYLEDNNMHVVGGSWDNPRSLRLRQSPGPGNSLGHMKFEMQNQWNIYLHDTPSRTLFAKDDRYFSHGCVRVDQPHELAQNLLSGHSAKDLQEIIATGQTRSIKLDKPLPVFVLYWSVFTNKDGQLHFRRDAYDRDSQTVTALAMADLYENAVPVVDQGN